MYRPHLPSEKIGEGAPSPIIPEESRGGGGGGGGGGVGEGLYTGYYRQEVKKIAPPKIKHMQTISS